MLELKNVCKKYDRDVLKKINLKFGNKGLICLVDVRNRCVKYAFGSKQLIRRIE